MTPNRVTIDDLREQAEGIKATIEEDARHMLRDQTVKVVVAGAVVVVCAVSLAYYLGSRRRR